MIVFEILFWIALAEVVGCFGIYPLFIRYFARNRIHVKTQNFEPVTVIIPARNEESLIEQKTRNLVESLYPEGLMEIVIVESGSDDNTVEIARQLPVKLLHSNEGKVQAINTGIQHSQTDIIVVTDADTLTEPDSIRNLVSYLNGNIGAVSGYSCLTVDSKYRRFYLESKLKYDREEWELRYNEGLVDCVRNLDGKLMAFKKSVVEKLPEGLLCDDFTLTLMTRKRGYRCIVAKDAPVWEYAPSGLAEELKQIRRRAAIGIDAGLRYMPGMMFNLRYGVFGMLTLPCRLLGLILLPILVAYIAVFLLVWSPLLGAGILAGATVLLLILKGPYPFIQIAGLCLALLDVIIRRTQSRTTWEKIRIDA